MEITLIYIDIRDSFSNEYFHTKIWHLKLFHTKFSTLILLNFMILIVMNEVTQIWASYNKNSNLEMVPQFKIYIQRLPILQINSIKIRSYNDIILRLRTVICTKFYKMWLEYTARIYIEFGYFNCTCDSYEFVTGMIYLLAIIISLARGVYK